MSSIQETPFLDIYIGNEGRLNDASALYQLTCALLKKNASIYGLPHTLNELSEDQREILQE